jgi:hypothetical protein
MCRLLGAPNGWKGHEGDDQARHRRCRSFAGLLILLEALSSENCRPAMIGPESIGIAALTEGGAVEEAVRLVFCPMARGVGEQAAVKTVGSWLWTRTRESRR